MNWKTFYALLSRDGHVARRSLVMVLVQNLLQPLLFTFVFGRVLTSGGMMQAGFKSVLLPGVIAISMVIAGVQAVAMPLITEFQFSREIEDRLLAPIENGWLAVEKIIAGMIQALVAGLVVIPAAWLTMGSGASVSFAHPFAFAMFCLLVALLAAAGGPGPRVQRGRDADRAHVQHHPDADADVRLRLLSVVVPPRVPRLAIRGAAEPGGVRERRFARSAGAAGAAHRHDDHCRRARRCRYRSGRRSASRSFGRKR